MQYQVISRHQTRKKAQNLRSKILCIDLFFSVKSPCSFHPRLGPSNLPSGALTHGSSTREIASGTLRDIIRIKIVRIGFHKPSDIFTMPKKGANTFLPEKIRASVRGTNTFSGVRERGRTSFFLVQCRIGR